MSEKITEKELVQKILAGEPYIIAEWRSGEAKLASGTDDRGKAFSRCNIVHRLELGEQALTLKERCVEGTQPSSVVIPYKKGQRVAVHLSLTEADRGAFYVRAVVSAIANQGNTSAASIPLALDTAVREGRIKAGQNVLLEAVGGGFTWGAVLIKW